MQEGHHLVVELGLNALREPRLATDAHGKSVERGGVYNTLLGSALCGDNDLVAEVLAETGNVDVGWAQDVNRLGERLGHEGHLVDDGECLAIGLVEGDSVSVNSHTASSTATSGACGVGDPSMGWMGTSVPYAASAEAQDAETSW